jgi:hypothetical protein
MGGERRLDRRATGVQKVVASDGNGGREVRYQFNIQRAKTWVGFVGTVFTLMLAIGGAVWGGLTFGIGHQIDEGVEAGIVKECFPGGKIDYHISKTAEALVDEFQEIVADDLAEKGEKLDALEAGQESAVQQIESLSVQQERNAEELKMLIQRAIDNGGG